MPLPGFVVPLLAGQGSFQSSLGRRRLDREGSSALLSPKVLPCKGDQGEGVLSGVRPVPLRGLGLVDPEENIPPPCLALPHLGMKS